MFKGLVCRPVFQLRVQQHIVDCALREGIDGYDSVVI